MTNHKHSTIITQRLSLHVLLLGLVSFNCVRAQEARIVIQADRPGPRVSRFLTGACLEDVNHEIYGGLYSQMIFGESFQEPPAAVPPRGFKAYAGRWTVREEVLEAGDGDGPKLVSEFPAGADGEVGVEMRFSDRRPGNAGLIVRVDRPGNGADNFAGYEITLDAAAQTLRLGRHRHNWEPIQDTRRSVPTGAWIPLVVKLNGSMIEVIVNGASVIRHDDGASALRSGRIGLRQWQREAQYRNLWIKTGAEVTKLDFEPDAKASRQDISGLWRLVRSGTASGICSMETRQPFVGRQYQRLEFASGQGAFGIENQGLNRWGMHWVSGKSYEGVVWARTERPIEMIVVLESADGARVHASKRLRCAAGDWQRLEFRLTPKAAEDKGRFSIQLTEHGTVDLGYVFLQPGAWGRFKGLPVRRDVAEALIDQGITVLRYGGSMVNHPEYRWKKMIGPRDRRPPYHGTWYPYSSDGWGILDFMDFCEAAGFEYIPAFNIDETPQDMADFIDYAKGPADSTWGRRRAANGHPPPYRLRYLELGNEERVDDAYAAKFAALATTIWANDPQLILVVGDFAYSQPITDSMKVTGAASRITQMTGQQKILDLARQHHREVWFDIHIWTGDPFNLGELRIVPTYVKALDQLAQGAAHKVVIFEFNANNHDQRRALANAWSVGELAALGDRLPVICSANCLQPDGQNDNGWDQGLLFLNPAQVWLQPPGWVTRMISRNYLPQYVPATVTGATQLHASAARSEDGRTLVVQAVNLSDKPVTAQLSLEGFRPLKSVARMEVLAAPLEAVNSAVQPQRVIPARTEWRHNFPGTAANYIFRPFSFTVMRFE